MFFLLFLGQQLISGVFLRGQISGDFLTVIRAKSEDGSVGQQWWIYCRIFGGKMRGGCISVYQQVELAK